MHSSISQRSYIKRRWPTAQNWLPFFYFILSTCDDIPTFPEVLLFCRFYFIYLFIVIQYCPSKSVLLLCPVLCISSAVLYNILYLLFHVLWYYSQGPFCHRHFKSLFCENFKLSDCRLSSTATSFQWGIVCVMSKYPQVESGVMGFSKSVYRVCVCVCVLVILPFFYVSLMFK